MKAKMREPSGTSFRSLRRAFNKGWKPPDVAVKGDKYKYMNSFARKKMEKK